MKSVSLQHWEPRAVERQSRYRSWLQRADRKTVLPLLAERHTQAFETVDCLACARCCKNYSPRFKPPDIKRIARHLRMKEAAFIEQYLQRDDEGDYVLRIAPCPFLGADNFCSIYEARPSDCQRFPYTDEDVFLKKVQITLKNSTFCPAVYWMLESFVE
jgi:uncharacterized protein